MRVAEAVMTETRRIAIDGTTKQMGVNFEVNFMFGRTTRASCPGAAHRLPNPENGCDDVEKVFVNNLGLTRSQAAALMGVHTIGKASLQNSGYSGWWQDEQNVARFNNNYYISIVNHEWGSSALSSGKALWIREDSKWHPEVQKEGRSIIAAFGCEQ